MDDYFEKGKNGSNRFVALLAMPIPMRPLKDDHDRHCFVDDRTEDDVNGGALSNQSVDFLHYISLNKHSIKVLHFKAGKYDKHY